MANNFRWQTKNKKQLSNAVRTFNMLRTKMIKENPEMELFLPEKKNVSDLKNSIKSTKDLRNEINSVKRFKPSKVKTKLVGENKDILTTNYETKEVKLKLNRINRAKKKKAELLDLSTEKGNTGTIKENSLRPKKDRESFVRSKEEWEIYTRAIDKQSKTTYGDDSDQIYYDNYFKSWDKNFLGQEEELKERLMRYSPSELFALTGEKAVFHLTYHYSPEDASKKLDAIKLALDYHEGITEEPEEQED